MMAPITPFLADYLWGVLRPADGPELVHLASWPTWAPALIDPALWTQMAARPAAGRARPVGPVGGLGADQAAARAGAGLVGAARLRRCRPNCAT